MNISTNWDLPHTYFITGIISLNNCLTSGHNARLIRLNNEDCAFPIKIFNLKTDFRCYKFSIGLSTTINNIKNSTYYNEFQKYLTLNYISVYGSQEAIERYYKTGICDKDNFNGIGINHLIKVDDYIEYLESVEKYTLANNYRKQYRSTENDVSYFFDFYMYNGINKYVIKKFKHKLWVVEITTNNVTPKAQLILSKIFTIIKYSIKFIPKKSELRMKEYKIYDFRIGSIINGFDIQFQIPNKFSFK